jgi:glyoxylase-like metal-dependent hydrolase (beta-lactamase superfamily II)
MRISPRCYAVTGLGYSTPWCVNAGFIVGDGATLLVDAGANRLAAQTLHGYATAVRPGNQLMLVNTERHFDHMGGNGYFHGLGVPIWGHAGIVRQPADFEREIAEFSAEIIDPARRAFDEGRAFYAGTTLANPDHPIREDRTIEFGGCAARILLTPGHTLTNLSVWFPEDGVLYTGDCLIRGYVPNLESGGPDEWKLWLQSLDRLEALPVRVLMTGHGLVSRDGEVKECIARVRAVLIEALSRGRAPTGAGPG